ncbi:MAG: hypothetical protein H7210_04810 [Pyrinomonadaceae bacterium]|nr:hypothetical protein [Phycisphaerales bacterium]
MSLRSMLVAITSAIAVFSGLSVQGQVTLLTQERNVWTRTTSRNQEPFVPPGGASDTDTLVASDFGAFTPAIVSSVAPDAFAHASQNSLLLSTGLTASGTADASVVGRRHVEISSQSQSFIRVGFEVAGPMRYKLVGGATLDRWDGPYSLSRIRMYVDGLYDGSIGFPLVEDLAVDQRGNLTPGTYEYYVSTELSVTNIEYAVAGADVASFDFALTFHCPADFNVDGSVGSQDFFDFLTAFLAADPSADYTADSAISSEDFFAFLGYFFSPC